jgi:hypothetical protein
MQIPETKKSDPDVLRVTAFVLKNSEVREWFSVSDAALTKELNGISEYRIAEILHEICLQPNGPNSKKNLATVDGRYSHSNSGSWTLNAETYFSYLSYISVQNSEKSNKLATFSLWVASTAVLGNIIAFALGFFG